MANTFTVRPESLRILSKSLTSLADKLNEARTVTQQVDTSGFGNDKLHGAADHFVSHWSYQGQQISTTAAEVGKRLAQAADQYQSVEDAQLQAQGQGTTA